MVSDRARQQWGAFVKVRGADTALFRERDELHRFLVGLQLRGEPLSAADLGALLDEADVDGDAREQLVERIEWGLALLHAYGNQVRLDEDAYDEVDRCDGFEI